MDSSDSDRDRAASLREESLRADCASCAGLCCVALPFARSPEFAFDKGAGDPCTHLQDDMRCRIHPVLRDRGFKGCTAFDCLGAGQKSTQVTFSGTSWRDVPESRDLMFAAFRVMRSLHELLWYLNQAMAVPAAERLHGQVLVLYGEIDRLTRQGADEILAVDVAAQRTQVNVLLRQVSAQVRARVQRTPSAATPELGPGADLVGAALRGADLRGQDLRGAHLIAADLRDADLGGADLIGADLRDADVRGADLSGALFLTQFQVNATNGDRQTLLPPLLRRPAHWG